MSSRPCIMKNDGNDATCTIIPAIPMETQPNLGVWSNDLGLRFKEFKEIERREDVHKYLQDLTNEKEKLQRVLLVNVQDELKQQKALVLGYYQTVSAALTQDEAAAKSARDVYPSRDYETDLRVAKSALRILVKFEKDLRKFEAYFHDLYKPLLDYIAELERDLEKHKLEREVLERTYLKLSDDKRHSAFQSLYKKQARIDKTIIKINDLRSQFREMVDLSEEKDILAFSRWRISDSEYKPVNIADLKLALVQLLPPMQQANTKERVDSEVCVKAFGEKLIERLAAYLNARMIDSTRHLHELLIVNAGEPENAKSIAEEMEEVARNAAAALAAAVVVPTGEKEQTTDMDTNTQKQSHELPPEDNLDGRPPKFPRTESQDNEKTE